MSTATPAAAPVPTVSFKVFNQGGRLFTHHELQIKAGVFTTVPPHLVEGVKKLITAYPHELTSAETADLGSKNAAQRITDLTDRAEKAEAQVAKLQKILVQDEKQVAERAEKAETALANALQDVKLASDRILSLNQQLSAANDKIEAQTADLERLTNP